MEYLRGRGARGGSSETRYLRPGGGGATRRRCNAVDPPFNSEARPPSDPLALKPAVRRPLCSMALATCRTVLCCRNPQNRLPEQPGRAGGINVSDKPPMHRRSFLRRILGGATAVGALGAVTGYAHAEHTPVCTDGDTGGYADPVGRGRRCGTTTSGCSDSDSGNYGDPSGNGRRCSTIAPTSGCSDSDSGNYGDPSGNGRRCAVPPPTTSGCSDSDSGTYADTGGNGRRCAVVAPTPAPCTDNDKSDPIGGGRRCAPAPRNCSDSDTGSYGDPLGRGRRC